LGMGMGTPVFGIRLLVRKLFDRIELLDIYARLMFESRKSDENIIQYGALPVE